MVTVEGDGLFILGVDHQRKNSDFRSQRPLNRIPQVCASKLAP